MLKQTSFQDFASTQWLTFLAHLSNEANSAVAAREAADNPGTDSIVQTRARITNI